MLPTITEWHLKHFYELHFRSRVSFDWVESIGYICPTYIVVDL